MDEFGFYIFEIIPFFFLVIVFLIWRANKKRIKNSPPPEKGEKPIYDIKVMYSSDHYTFCPYCNTKVTFAPSRRCHVCYSSYICPKCRKCVNRDQHRGI